ncbi:MAG: hypothetical protein ACJAS1_004083 [Oleiphilaceae bacterium]|jgi:hypothetical protein
MKSWNDVVKQLILGSQQVPSIAIDTFPADLKPSIEALASENTEKKLLSIASLLNQYKLAGTCPWVKAPASFCESPIETKPYCNPNVRHIVSRILVSKDERLLSQCLRLVSEAGQILPVDLIQSIFVFLEKAKINDGSLLKALGNRGTWIIEQNPVWLECFGSVEASNWIDSSGVKRKNDFLNRRLNDPDKALNELLEIWKTEPVKQRIALLDVIVESLEPSDLDFLISLEKDRSNQIRSMAVTTRLRLEDSVLTSVILSDLREIFSTSKGLLKKTKFNVTLPENFKDYWTTYGLDESLSQIPGVKKVGKKAGWLYQLLSLVPPTLLAKALECELSKLIKITDDSEYSIEIMNAFNASSDRFFDLDYLASRLSSLSDEYRLFWLVDRVCHYKLSVIEPFLVPVLNWFAKSSGARNDTTNLSNLIVEIQKKCWVENISLSRELSIAVIDACLSLNLKEGPYYQFFFVINDLGYGLDVGAFDVINKKVCAQKVVQIDMLIRRLEQRVALHKEFSNE